MPSFDVISEVDMHEITNAVENANREVANRFDFKGSGAEFTLKEQTISLKAQNDFQLKQMIDIFNTKCSKREIDIKSMKVQDPQIAGSHATQQIKIIQGLDSTLAKNIVKKIKDSKLKVQAAIQGTQVRVTGKKRDDLQEVIAFLKELPFELPLQFDNFRD